MLYNRETLHRILERFNEMIALYSASLDSKVYQKIRTTIYMADQRVKLNDIRVAGILRELGISEIADSFLRGKQFRRTKRQIFEVMGVFGFVLGLQFSIPFALKV